MSATITGAGPRLRRAVVGASVAAGLLLASACADDGNQGNGTPTSQPQNQASQNPGAPDNTPSTTDSQSQSTTSPDNSAGQPSTTPGQDGGDLGAPVATRTSGVEVGTVKLELFQPKRRDGALYLTARLSAVGKSARIWYALSDQDRQAGDSENFAPDGFQIVDGKHKKVYLVAHDGAGHCFCAPRDLGSATRQPGVPVLVSATFAAPPEDVTSVNIQIPTFGMFLDVPVG